MSAVVERSRKRTSHANRAPVVSEDRSAQGCGPEVLASLVESSVLPRIRQVYSPAFAQAGDAARNRTRVDQLVAAVLGKGRISAEDVLLEYLSGDATEEQACLDLLAPAAARLGDGWLDDDFGFYEVTTGTAQLHQLLRFMDTRSRRGINQGDFQRNIVMAVAPGDQHSFGISMLEFFFRRQGWNTNLLAGGAAEEVAMAVNEQHVDVVAFSCSCVGLLDSLISAIELTRSESVNRDISVMAGGHLFADDKTLGRKVGADLVAQNAWEAVEMVRQLFGKQSRRGL